ncbi:hypothetical protein FRC10_007149, partial [Ceratobasidium sp. 414]
MSTTTATPAKHASEGVPNLSKSCTSLLLLLWPKPGMEVDVAVEQEGEDKVMGPLFEYLLIKQNIEHDSLGYELNDLVVILTSVSVLNVSTW